MLHKKYLQEFKAAAVREVESGKNINEVARALCVSPTALRDWCRKAERSRPLGSQR